MNKYQSLHTMVFGVSGILTEVQIRTEEMHIEADYGIAANFFSQKNNLLKKDTRSLWVNRVIEMENTENTAGGFLENLKCDILQDRIFVFTNKGESIDLPKGATVIDFAYCVHTDIGNHAVKAEINGKLMPVTTRLNLGEVVNVIVNKNATPSLSWLNFVKTRVAKEKICLYLRKIGKDRKIREGYKILQKEFDIAGLGLFKNFNFKKINFELEKKLNKKFNAVEDLCVAVSEGNVRAVDVVNAIKKPLIKNVKGMKVNIKVVAKNRFGLLREVSEVFYKHSLDMIYLKGWGSSKSENAYFNVQVVVSSIESINYIFDELEQVDGVKYVYRIPYRVVYLLSFLMFLVGAFWIFHPFVLNSIMKSGRTIEETGYMVNLTIYSCLFVLFMIILYVANIAKNHLPYMRNKKMLIILSFGVPALAFITLLIELFYFQLKLNWPTLIIELVIIYTYLGISFRNLKKYT